MHDSFHQKHITSGNSAKLSMQVRTRFPSSHQPEDQGKPAHVPQSKKTKKSSLASTAALSSVFACLKSGKHIGLPVKSVQML